MLRLTRESSGFDMNQFQKNVAAIAVAVVAVVSISLGINFAWQAHTRSVQEEATRTIGQRTEWQKENIRSLKDLSDVGKLSTEEQDRLDRAGNDVDGCSRSSSTSMKGG